LELLGFSSELLKLASAWSQTVHFSSLIIFQQAFQSRGGLKLQKARNRVHGGGNKQSAALTDSTGVFPADRADLRRAGLASTSHIRLRQIVYVYTHTAPKMQEENTCLSGRVRFRAC
jgi:hypothetical protein